MTAPERIWAFSADDIAENEGGATIVAHESYQPYAAEYVRADLAAVQPAQVRVKPLVWGKWGEAKGGGAKYSTYEFGNNGLWNCVCYPHEAEQYRLARGVTLDAAKAAAQADYAARILAAIEPQPDPRDAVIARLVWACEEIASITVHSGGDVHGVTSREWHGAFQQAQDEASSALAAAKAVRR